MIDNLLSILGQSSLFIAFASVLILALRKPIRLQFGAQLSYQIWLLIPIVILFACLPKTEASSQINSIAQPVSNLIHQGTKAIEVHEWISNSRLLRLWLFGSLFSATYFCWLHWRFQRMLGTLEQKSGLYFSKSSMIGPILLGVFRQKIILPSAFEQTYSEHQRELIIAHESMHQQRGDPWFNLLCAILQCVFWFHPLLHLATRYFRIDQELACDASVITDFPASRRAYAEAMLKTQQNHFALAVSCHLLSYQPLKERIMQLQNPAPSRLIKQIGNVLVASLFASAAYASWAMPAHVLEDMSTSKNDAKSNFAYKTKFEFILDGAKVNAATVSKAGEDAQISVDGLNAKWDILFRLTPAKTSNGDSAVMIKLTLQRNGEIVAEPRIMTGLGVPAKIEQKNASNPDGNFHLTFTPELQ